MQIHFLCHFFFAEKRLYQLAFSQHSQYIYTFSCYAYVCVFYIKTKNQCSFNIKIEQFTNYWTHTNIFHFHLIFSFVKVHNKYLFKLPKLWFNLLKKSILYLLNFYLLHLKIVKFNLDKKISVRTGKIWSSFFIWFYNLAKV